MPSSNTAGQPKHNLTNPSDGLRIVLPTTPAPSAQQVHTRRSAFEFKSSPPAESSSSPSAESSSSGRNHLAYHVFISHRGIDTKHTLATSIYDKLHSKGLRVFLDKNALQPGDFFPHVLEEAIAKASLHIAIFSENYAESSWCLNELELMLKTKTIFIPIFYLIDPATPRWVKEGKGIYANAFVNYEKKKRYSAQKLESWKLALHKASFYIGEIIDDQWPQCIDQHT